MKYFSETLNKVYDTEEELVKAEKEVADKKASREMRAKEVETAIKEAQEANQKAHDLLAAFCKDYGSFHKTFKDVRDMSLFDFFSDMLF